MPDDTRWALHLLLGEKGGAPSLDTHLDSQTFDPRNGRSRRPCYRRLRPWRRPPHHRRTSPPPIFISSVRLRILARNATCQVYHRRLVFCRTSISEPLGADKIDEPKHWSRVSFITRRRKHFMQAHLIKRCFPSIIRSSTATRFGDEGDGRAYVHNMRTSSVPFSF